jgi:hypothetical protein
MSEERQEGPTSIDVTDKQIDIGGIPSEHRYKHCLFFLNYHEIVDTVCCSQCIAPHSN